ncbi:MAG: undecaprenyl-diphosphatase [Clostridiales bacterium 43-6]|nr:MAG: undecaprenyl-diphosphatase [Clostridiales bacterium 43-6]
MDFIELLKTIFIGIVEGITEWLPISSTGHMYLTDAFIKMNITEDFKEMFMVVIQLGAIMAVVLLYFNKLNPISSKKTKEEKINILKLWTKVLAACVPAGIIGLLFDDQIDAIFYNPVMIAAMLIVYGVLFIVIENRNKNKAYRCKSIDRLTYKTALIIGAFQVLSLIPGTSRSGATIVGAMLIGTSRIVAAEFSFFLAIPVMFGASFYKLAKFGFHFTGTEIIILIVGMITAFIVSVVAIKFLVGFIRKHDFKSFGYYRIVLGIIVLLYFLFSSVLAK